jgi:hypothetical protein
MLELCCRRWVMNMMFYFCKNLPGLSLDRLCPLQGLKGTTLLVCLCTLIGCVWKTL